MLKREFDIEVELVEGRYGEFTMLIDGEPAITNGVLGFVGVQPSLKRIREQVERSLNSSGS
jgi:hypothetical protein